MWNRNIGTTEQLVRVLLAGALIGFSFQEDTSLIQAIAGYLVGGWILMTTLVARYLTWMSWDRIVPSLSSLPFPRKHDHSLSPKRHDRVSLYEAHI